MKKFQQIKKYNSRKLILALAIILMGFIPMILKFNDPMFVQLFKQWANLTLGVFAIYIGGNVSQKYVEKRHSSTYNNISYSEYDINQDSDPEWGDSQMKYPEV